MIKKRLGIPDRVSIYLFSEFEDQMTALYEEYGEEFVIDPVVLSKNQLVKGTANLYELAETRADEEGILYLYYSDKPIL